ncbi:MAG: RnfABCDGE type electron transport complex subunit D [Desulfobacterales bacterium]|nr:RnfABCDGE type electron transport complex subunit D [Desulfobacterales bacterium]
MAVTACRLPRRWTRPRFASPAFHLLTGYTLIGAFFLAPEDSSSPVNFIPMLIYGAVGGSCRGVHPRHRRLRRRAGVSPCWSAT